MQRFPGIYFARNTFKRLHACGGKHSSLAHVSVAVSHPHIRSVILHGTCKYDGYNHDVDRNRKLTLLDMAYAAGLSSHRWKASTLASIAPFPPPRFVDCIQSCGRAEAHESDSSLVVPPIDGHTFLVLVAQFCQLILSSAHFPQRWHVLAGVFVYGVLRGLCSVQAPSRAQV